MRYADAPEGAWRDFIQGADLPDGPVRTAKLDGSRG